MRFTCHVNDQNCHTEALKTSLLYECRQLYPGNDFVFIKTVCKATEQFLPQNAPDFIDTDEWASNFPDLNPVDNCILNILQGLVY